LWVHEVLLDLMETLVHPVTPVLLDRVDTKGIK
jgi:hypothetical protein